MKTKAMSWLTMLAAGAAGVTALMVRGASQASAPGDFQPIMEAELPIGFPSPGPVGEIRLKSYPAYRMAETKSEQGGGFWTLFRHIKANDIAMTAPVEMTYSRDSDGKTLQTRMAFLYGDPSLGTAEVEGPVQVVDVPAMQVVSLGLSGPHTPERISEAAGRLRTWIGENSPQYVAAGDVRVMGYNSPFVPRDRRYFEVQIPVEEREPAGE